MCVYVCTYIRVMFTYITISSIIVKPAASWRLTESASSAPSGTTTLVSQDVKASSKFVCSVLCMLVIVECMFVVIDCVRCVRFVCLFVCFFVCLFVVFCFA